MRQWNAIRKFFFATKDKDKDKEKYKDTEKDPPCAIFLKSRISNMILRGMFGVSIEASSRACLGQHLGEHCRNNVNNGQQSAVLHASVMQS